MENIESWEKGESEVLIATGALGAGVDISGIEFVLHLGEGFGLINYVQESGRGGRAGEIVECITLLSQEGYDRLLSKDVRNLRADQKALREFLITLGCRRRPMSRYMDGVDKEMDCSELNLERCDNCWKGYKNTEVGKRKREMEEEERRVRRHVKSYNGHGELVRESESEAGMRWKELTDALRDLRGKCTTCWVMEGIWEADHSFSDCEELESMMGRRYEQVRMEVKYTENSGCYVCSRPCDMCEYYVGGKQCRVEDVIIPAALTAFVCRESEMLYMIMEKAGRGFSGLDSYVEWLGKKCRLGEVNGTNALSIFLGIIEVKSRY
jgi:superfamily II DNA helicase RecQ